MFPFLVLGVLFAVPVSAADPADPVAPVTVYTNYEHGIPDNVHRAMQHEVATIIAPTGLTVEWRSLSALYGRVNITLAIAQFKGNCDVKDLTVYPVYPYTLGTTAISEGEILPYTNIYCDAIRAFIAPQLLSIEPGDRTLSFGRALGRVLAHELYHILAHTKRHGSHGLAEPKWPPGELMAREFRFDQKEMQQLRSAMMRPLLQANGLIGESDTDPKKSAFITSGCLGCHGSDGTGTQWGPSLHAASQSYDLARLRFRLTDTRTLMYHRAQQLGVLWPSLTDADMSNLIGFLKGGVP
jgi:cytochrome c553